MFLIAYNVNILGTPNQAHRIALDLRETGRSQLRLLLNYLAEEGSAPPPEVVAVGETYEQLGRQAGLSFTETVGVFLYFRDFLYDSVVDVYQASGQRAAREWANMHRRIAAFTNAVLLALIAAHERRPRAAS